MSKKIFIVYGHHNTQKSFNASIRDAFIEEAKKNGHEIDLEENKIMLRALNENSVIVADVMPLFGNETEEDIVN